MSRSSVTLYRPQLEIFVDMIGDRLVITDYHRQAAAKIFPRIQQALNSPEDSTIRFDRR